MTNAWLPGIDAEKIDLLPGSVIASAAVLFVYGPNFGGQGGPARQTPQAWVQAQSKP